MIPTLNLAGALTSGGGATIVGTGFIVATGGTINVDGDYKYHVFNSSGTFEVTAGETDIAELLIVAGGGGGGNCTANADGAAGGGGGGVRALNSVALSVSSYAVIVGAGGVGAVTRGTNGDDSSFDASVSLGGGGGSSSAAGGGGGANGGSGGGGSVISAAGLGTAGQGNDGGVGNNSSPNYGGGGGGGGSAVGAPGTSATGGAGGAGTSNSITGSSVTYGGGGGGGTFGGGTAGSGGSGGGGAGSTATGNGSDGTANTGGGGGGAGASVPTGGTGGAGGDGVVIVRYQFKGAHQYWRINGITIPGGGFFEISELTMVDTSTSPHTSLVSAATKTSSDAPAGGSLNDIFDNNLSTRCFWSEATAEDPNFWIKFDFGGGSPDGYQRVTGVEQGGFDTSTRYMSAFTLQWSDDDSTWIDAGSKSGLSYPGNNTLSETYDFPEPT